jgi:acyl-CoA synthetase (NDP forming)
MGIYNPYVGLNTIIPFVDLPLERGDVAFVGQSGWASETFIISGYDRGLRISRAISSGNQSDLGTADYVEYFGNDPKTKVIAAYVEGIREGHRLFQVAREVSKRKPVIIWKAGRTKAGARAVASHTGSLAGSDQIYDGAFRQAGIIRAEHLEELIDLTVAFAPPHPPSGNRVGILVEAGGGAVAAADACESQGLEVSPLPTEVKEELKDYLRGINSPSSTIRNPVDLIWPPFSEFSRILPRCLEIMAKAVDILLMVTYYPLTDEPFADGIRELGMRMKKPIFVVPTYPSRQSQGLGLYTQRGIPAFPTPERAAKAISVLVQYSNRKSG